VFRVYEARRGTLGTLVAGYTGIKEASRTRRKPLPRYCIMDNYESRRSKINLVYPARSLRFSQSSCFAYDSRIISATFTQFSVYVVYFVLLLVVNWWGYYSYSLINIKKKKRRDRKAFRRMDLRTRVASFQASNDIFNQTLDVNLSEKHLTYKLIICKK